MLNSNCSRIDAIIYTHEHSDHVAGLDDIRPFFFNQGKIPIYAHKRVLNELKKRFYYIFDENYSYPGSPKVIENVISSNFNTANSEKEIISFIKKNKFSEPIILGGGTNILFKNNIDRNILKIEIKGIELINETEFKSLSTTDK